MGIAATSALGLTDEVEQGTECVRGGEAQTNLVTRLVAAVVATAEESIATWHLGEGESTESQTTC